MHRQQPAVGGASTDIGGSWVKLSRYNHLFSFKDQLRVLYNAASGSVVTLDETSWDLLNNANPPEPERLDQRTRTLLADQGMLVPEERDERAAALTRYRERRASTRSLRLTIAPTMDCNFSCPYCYEHRVPGVMSDETADQVVSFATNRIQQSERLSVTWYGGEPLLVPDRVIDLTGRLRQLAESMDKEWWFSIVTNGYRMDGTMARQLADAGITDAQVTLDGPPEFHDNRRKHNNGTGTFQRILENLRSAVDVLETVRVRMNVDAQNATGWQALMEILAEAGLAEKVRFSLAHVDTINDANAPYQCNCLDAGAFADTWVDWAMDAYRQGKTMGLPAMTVCSMVSRWAYVIGPGGWITSCWNHPFNPETAIGHVSKPEQVDPEDTWEQFDPMNWAECRECTLLPACMGNCPDRLVQSGVDAACERWKHCLRETVILHTLQKVKGGQHVET